MLNYLKTRNGKILFFNDAIPESIEEAYTLARLIDCRPSVYRPVQVAGPWDACPVIGHRPRAQILHDLSTETDEEKLIRLREEDEALRQRFIDVGRFAPRVQVAA